MERKGLLERRSRRASRLKMKAGGKLIRKLADSTVDNVTKMKKFIDESFSPGRRPVNEGLKRRRQPKTRPNDKRYCRNSVV